MSDTDTPTELDLLTTGQIAEMFTVTAETVRSWITAGDIKAVSLPGGRKQYRIRREDAIEFARARYGSAAPSEQVDLI